MARVFISYRRQEGEGHTGWIADGLRHRGHDVRTDVQIRPGEDFVDAIRRSIAWCDALLVVMGPRWLDVRDSAGRRRLHAEEDWVRFEIEEGLAAPGVNVIPVLVQEAQMPGAADLPVEIAAFARRHAQELSATRWDFDMDRLSDGITRQPLPAAAIAAACVGGALLFAIPGIAAYEAVRELTSEAGRTHALWVPRLALVWVVLWSLVTAGAAGATALALRRSAPEALRSALKGLLAGALAGAVGGAITALLRTDGGLDLVDYFPAYAVLGLIAGAMVAPTAERAAAALGGAAGGVLAGLIVVGIERADAEGLLGEPRALQVLAVALIVGSAVAAAMVAHVGAPQHRREPARAG